ncbi:LuxR C-terminal-related transcriptional regulator [Kutzneria kofuensis]|uniref:DNA-binding NarL/FixJ family response regulator n=1 Tax=Kutzneria kofuensis TaxID=103725 RepID=A0A7W9KM19_9PSEU|nr:response regulator transcription factor [Kutzneria kofuensis]MBB5894957.1 DNA-binding NarL/FixJ family response regulator [Kutzneria kofuensis]
MPVRVVLAEDDAALRAGLRLLLEAGGRVEVVAEVDPGPKLPAVVRAQWPDVVLVSDVSALRGLDGGPPVAVLAASAVDDAVNRAIDLGAQGFLLADAEPESLVRAVLDLAAGGAVFDPRVAAALLPRLRGNAMPDNDLLRGLSTRERQVLDLIAGGRSNAAIATELGLTEATVKSYVSALLGKLGVRNRVQAALILRQMRP